MAEHQSLTSAVLSNIPHAVLMRKHPLVPFLVLNLSLEFKCIDSCSVLSVFFEVFPSRGLTAVLFWDMMRWDTM